MDKHGPAEEKVESEDSENVLQVRNSFISSKIPAKLVHVTSLVFSSLPFC